MDVEAGANKYEWLQVLLAVPLVLVHLVFYMAMLMGLNAFVGIAIGVVETAASRRMSTGSALGGLRPWLLGVGVCTTAVSVGMLVYQINALGQVPWPT